MAFAQAGASVACVDRDVTLGSATVETLRALGCEAISIAADVTDAIQVQSYVRDTRARFGRIDVFANNAGIEGVIVDGGRLAM